jgi:hypothetical protein
MHVGTRSEKGKNDYWRAFPMGKAKAGLEAQKAEQRRACPMEKQKAAEGVNGCLDGMSEG